MIITVKEGSKVHKLEFMQGQTIYDVLQANGIQSVHAFCGGKGACKKCEVTVRSGNETEIVLSCLDPARDGMFVELNTSKRVSFAVDSFLDTYAPSGEYSAYALAFDVGTSTVVCHLMSLETGKSIGSLCGMNVQRVYGKNVLSRLQASAEGHFEELHSMLINQLNAIIKKICRNAGIDKTDIHFISVAGNTIMEHFVAGLNPAANGITPFVPSSLFGEIVSAKNLGIDLECDLFLCPAVDALLGGDAVAGILSSGMESSGSPMMMIDLGANGDMVLGCKGKYVACAADASSAVSTSLMAHGMTATEGAISAVRFKDGKLEIDVLGDTEPIGVCGSGFIDALDLLYSMDALDETGHITSKEQAPKDLAPYIITVDGRPAFALTKDQKVFVSEQDVSSFQLGKAALYAGIRILSKELNVRLSDISKCFLAGCFGTFISPNNAASIGLIPKELMDKSEKIGNSAIGGAQSAAVSSLAREEMNRIAKSIRYIALSSHPDFNDEYFDGMMFD